jgi:hypothetical protein
MPWPSSVPAPVEGLTRIAELGFTAYGVVGRRDDGMLVEHRWVRRKVVLPAGRFRRVWTGAEIVCGLTFQGKLVCGGRAAGWPARVLRGARSPIEDVALGMGFGCVLLANGSARCAGETGVGTTLDTVSAVPDAAAASVGSLSACAIRGDRRVSCWGASFHGELGDGTKEHRSQPVDVKGLVRVSEVRLGMHHTCARTEDGRVLCWGWNRDGQLGDGTSDERLSPVPVSWCPSRAAAISGPSPGHAPIVARLERGRCMGQCPAYRVDVFADGTAVFTGTYDVATYGIRRRKLDAPSMKALERAFETSGFAALDESCCRLSIADAPALVVTALSRGRLKTIETYNVSEVPRSVRDLGADIDEIVGTKELVGQ